MDVEEYIVKQEKIEVEARFLSNLYGCDFDVLDKKEQDDFLVAASLCLYGKEQ